MNVYFIGGSPCSGKSTVTELIANKFNLHYFNVDELLSNYIKKASDKGKVFSAKQCHMNVDETWLRDPVVQCMEELAIYREIFEFIFEDLSKVHAPNGIIAEGAAYLPELMKQIGVDKNHYICIVPTKDFQYFHYKQRTWVPYVLESCSNKELAFENWMERDSLFAIDVKNNAEDLGYTTVLTDETNDITYSYQKVCQTFGLI